jgi:bifunctional UDP-N-acetylglucosamine pyrophosphorylase/glucosamine-1-phosphate N-acetyltransferase
MVAGIILAGGKGSRMNSDTVNKVVLPFHGKPLIQYGVELLQHIVNPLIVVTGAFPESVHEALQGYHVSYVNQEPQLGTGHAVMVAIEPLKDINPTELIIGYGDHMMFYTTKTIENLLKLHRETNAVATPVTCILDDPAQYGRILRNGDRILGVVETKDATEEQKKIKEINTGFYCFDYAFVRDHVRLIKPSSVSKEYYLPELIPMALAENKRISGLIVPYTEMGIGINKFEELCESQKLYELIRQQKNEI